MNLLKFFLLLQLTAPLALGQAVRQTEPVNAASQTESLVTSLYTQVIAHHPLGIPNDADMKIFAPYLSKALLHRMDLAIACGADWHRQNPGAHLKPELAWMELGPFSGENERVSPQTFSIEQTQSDNDGSFRVYVRLTRVDSGGGTSVWRVAPIVIRENNHFVIDDVIYLKDKGRDDEGRLSEGLSAGCDGARWVGFSDSAK